MNEKFEEFKSDIEGGGRKMEMSQKGQEFARDSRAYHSGYSKGMIKHHENLKKVFEYIEKEIDLEVIQDIIGEYLLKSGVPKENWNILDVRDFFVLPLSYKSDNEPYAWYDSIINTVGINASNFKDKEPVFLVILHAVIHELVHSLSHNRVVIDKKTRRGVPVRIDVVSGYSVTSKRKNFFESFNEGVTERITCEVAVEYFKRVGKVGLKDFTQRIEQGISSLSRYSIYMFFVDHICEKLSQYSGLAKPDIWNAVMRGYFTGDSLYQKETKELLESSFSDGFVEQISELSNKTDMGALGRFAGRFDFPGTKEFALQWLKHLGLNKETTL